MGIVDCITDVRRELERINSLHQLHVGLWALQVGLIVCLVALLIEHLRLGLVHDAVVHGLDLLVLYLVDRRRVRNLLVVYLHLLHHVESSVWDF